MKTSRILLWFTAISMGCSSSMMVNDTLVNDSQTLTVEGRQGWLINQKLSFGPYQSEEVKRGWTFSYDIPFLVQFKGAKEKLQFQLNEGEHRASVYCLGKATQRELPMLEDMFRLSLKDQNVFAGAIVTDYSATPWEFLVQKNYNKLPARDFTGTLQNQNTQIDLREIQHTAQGKNTWGEPLGYEFVLDGEVIGAVEVLNKGRIIIKNSASDEMKLLVASTSAALLLRSDLNDTVGQ
uniref:Uncharacterized protein n=1 Tax=Roseihalotalea indica TaxID=2867963 RepID=A0AA49GGF1_9BACT|nr:hypothetical protein K4G66_17120 [Tunicatimonas sp. TK19036]